MDGCSGRSHAICHSITLTQVSNLLIISEIHLGQPWHRSSSVPTITWSRTVGGKVSLGKQIRADSSVISRTQRLGSTNFTRWHPWLSRLQACQYRCPAGAAVLLDISCRPLPRASHASFGGFPFRVSLNSQAPMQSRPRAITPPFWHCNECLWKKPEDMHTLPSWALKNFKMVWRDGHVTGRPSETEFRTSRLQ